MVGPVKLSLPLAVLLGCWLNSSFAQDAESESAQSLLAQTCAAAGVDLGKSEDDMSRSERRALRRCTQEAERQAAAGNQEDDGIVCRRESVVGTHRTVRICTTAAEREAARQSAREVMRDVTRSVGTAGREGG